jgi:glucoamylase
MRDYKMDWEFRAAEDGNIALTGEIDLPDNNEFMIAVAFGGSYQTTATNIPILS